MLTFLFVVFMFLIFGKLFFFSVRASWGLIKILFTLFFLPVVLIGLVIAGLFTVALPMLFIVGLISLFARRI